MRLLTSDEMKQVEQYAAKYGLAYQRMMENAGSACVRNIRNIIEGNDRPQKRNVVVVCGEGNNGGDGFVIARKLDENGYNVVIVLAAGYPKSQEATYMYKLSFQQFNMGYGSAVAAGMFILITVIALVFNRIFVVKEDY